jgi:hypothetical protein
MDQLYAHFLTKNKISYQMELVGYKYPLYITGCKKVFLISNQIIENYNFD